MRLYRRSILAWSVKSARSTLERAPTASEFVDVWAWSQCKSSVTLCSSPKDAALGDDSYHALIGVKKGDPNNRWMRDSGAMLVLQTATVSYVAVPSESLVASGTVVARAVLISAMVGVGTSRTVSQL